MFVIYLLKSVWGLNEAGHWIKCLLPITPSFFHLVLPLVEARIVCLLFMPLLCLSPPKSLQISRSPLWGMGMGPGGVTVALGRRETRPGVREG